MTDMGTFCSKGMHTRGWGSALGCANGLEKSFLFCYKPCDDGYAGTFKFCFSMCPAGTIPCGALMCLKEVEGEENQCQKKTMNVVKTVIKTLFRAVFAFTSPVNMLGAAADLLSDTYDAVEGLIQPICKFRGHNKYEKERIMAEKLKNGDNSEYEPVAIPIESREAKEDQEIKEAEDKEKKE